MLNSKILPQILKQVLSPGIQTSIIVTMGGDLLATSGGSANDKLIGAICVSIWSSYHKASSDLNFIILECEEGRLVVSSVSPQFLVCVCGDTKVEFGILKAKAQALKKSFGTTSEADNILK